MINNNNDYYKKFCRCTWLPVALIPIKALWPAQNFSSPQPPPGPPALISPIPVSDWEAPQSIIKLLSQVQTLIVWWLCVTFDILFDKYCNTLHNAGGQSSNDVLEFSAEEQKWTNVGSMLKKREEHAVSVINYNAIKAYCNWWLKLNHLDHLCFWWLPIFILINQTLKKKYIFNFSFWPLILYVAD